MKTQIKVGRFLGGALVSTALLLLGCSDGVLPEKGGGTNPSGSQVLPPDIKDFSANPLTVERGGSTTLLWEVNGADKVEIASTDAKNKFSYSTDKDFKSKTVVGPENLQETTTFILTATKNPPKAAGGEGETPPASGMIIRTVLKQATPPAPGAETPLPTTGPQVTKQSVTVIVNGPKATLSIEKFYADKDSVEAGDAVVLQWSVVPAEAKVTLSASPGDQPILVPLEQCIAPKTTTKEMEINGQVVEAKSYPAVGCATVHPQEDTTYKLVAQLADKSVDKSVAVQVGKPLTVNLTPTVDLKQGYVLKWQASSDKAKVTLSADPAVTGVDLTGDKDYQGSVIIPLGAITQTTTFTAIAKLGDKTSKPTSVTVTPVAVSIGDCSKFAINSNAKGPLFMGEALVISWTIPDIASGLVSAVQVTGPDVDKQPGDMTKSQAIVTVKASGFYTVRFINAQGGDVCSPPPVITVQVISLAPAGPSYKVMRLVEDGNAKGYVYAGVDLGGFNEGTINEGKIKVAHLIPGTSDMTIDFFKAMKTYDSWSNKLTTHFMSKDVNNFPVNAIASSSKRLFVATSGVILYQDEDEKGNKSWKPLTTLYRRDMDGTYSGQHNSCFGLPQPGKKAQFSGDVVTLNQVCDMVASGDKLYVATDQGIYFLNNVENYISSHKSECWNGIQNKCGGSSNALTGHVVSDIEVVGSAVYAATDMGVYQSKDGGANWSSAGLDGKSVNAVAFVSGIDSSVIYAATDEGVYVREEGMVSDKSWKKAQGVSGKVYSVEVDPLSGAALAGAQSGLFVSRDGQTFSLVPLAKDKQPVVRSVKVRYDADKLGYYIYVGTEGGVLNAVIQGLKR